MRVGAVCVMCVWRHIYVSSQVNKIREIPQHPHIVVTHTDSEKLYVWNTVTQPNRALDKACPPAFLLTQKPFMPLCEEAS